MIEYRTAREIDSPRARRIQRRTAGLVAEYIHELSERHGHPAFAGDPEPRGAGGTMALAGSTGRVRG